MARKYLNWDYPNGVHLSTLEFSMHIKRNRADEHSATYSIIPRPFPFLTISGDVVSLQVCRRFRADSVLLCTLLIRKPTKYNVEHFQVL
jgi:hypothetical protein